MHVTKLWRGRSSCGSLSYRNLSKLLVLLQAIMLVSGCAAFRGFPTRVTDLSADLALLKDDMGAAAITTCLAAPSEACRNKIIAARMYAIDIQFSGFEEDLFRQTRESGFATTVATLGLTAAAAASTSPASQILSGIAAFTIGTREAFQKEVLAERTVIAIHIAMRANRMIVLARIRQGLRHNASEYPLATGLTDVDDYYFQGTVLGALIGITKVIGVQAEEAQRGLAIATGLSQSEAARALRAYANAPGLSEDEKKLRISRILQAIKDLEAPEPAAIASFITDGRPETEELQAKVARRLRLIP